MEYGIDISPAQMRKLKCGGAITLKSKHFVDDAIHRIKVMPNTSRRIQTAMKKNKGVRIALKPEEDIVAMTEGGAISLKKLGKTISKGAKKTTDIIKRGFDKEIVDSGVGKEIAKQLIDTGANFVLPTALSAASMMAGDPTGKSGELTNLGFPSAIFSCCDSGNLYLAGFGLFDCRDKPPKVSLYIEDKTSLFSVSAEK